MTTRAGLLLAACAAFAGCALLGAPAARTEPTADDERAVAELELRLRSLTSEAKALGAGSPQARCPRICDLAESICAIAEKMCAIAGRHPEQAAMADKCGGARKACEESKRDCSAACPR